MFDLLSYFKKLATEHNSIADSEDKPAFFREFSSSKIVLSINNFFTHQASHGSVVMVFQNNDDGNVTGPNADTLMRSRQFGVYLFTKVEYNNFEQIAAAKQLINSIFEDIIARMRRDTAQDIIPRFVKLNSINLQSLNAIADNYFGIVANFVINEPFVPVFDKAKWTSI